MGILLLPLIIAGLLGLYSCWERTHTSELWRAARDGDLDTVKRLIEAGEPVNQRKGLHEETPLHAAAGLGRMDVAAYLLEKGASVSARDCDGFTPLHSCARYNAKGGPSKATEDARNRIAKMLIARGAHVNAVASGEQTPLHKAVFEDNVALAELLLSHGANPNAKQSQGYTPLHMASIKGHDNPAIAALLLKNKADPTLTAHDGKTALDIAAEYAPRIAAVLRGVVPVDGQK